MFNLRHMYRLVFICIPGWLSRVFALFRTWRIHCTFHTALGQAVYTHSLTVTLFLPDASNVTHQYIGNQITYDSF
jgi:hypothetical protein